MHILHVGAHASSVLSRCCLGLPVAAVGVETALMGFQQRLSSSQTRAVLTRINGIVMYESGRLTGAPVVEHHVSSVRSCFGIGDGPAASSTTAVSADKASSKGSKGSKGSTGSPRKSTAASREASKAAVHAYIQSVHPNFTSSSLWDGRAAGCGKLPREGTQAAKDQAYDRADAVLIAMYSAVAHVVWSVLDTAPLERPGPADPFAAFAAAALPSCRLGTTAITQHDVPGVMTAIQRLHAQALKDEAKLRMRVQDAQESAAEDAADAVAAAPPAKRKKGTKTTAGGGAQAAAVTAAAPKPQLVERLYGRLRTQFDQTCKQLLLEGDSEAGLPALLPWRPNR